MNRLWVLAGVSLLVLTMSGGLLRAGGTEAATVESASEVLQALCALPVKGIPPALMQDAQGVAIIPNVLKAGFVVGGRFGRGVVLVRKADGGWGNPLFITLVGGGIGWQLGVQSTDVVLVFKTQRSLDRFLKGKGKLTLGADVAVAAGPLGRQAEAATDAQLKAEIFSYSRSRGLFAGLSLEGAAILSDWGADEAYYHVRGGRPADIMVGKGLAIPAGAEQLKGQLTRLSTPSVPPAMPVPMPPPPLPPLPPR